MSAGWWGVAAVLVLGTLLVWYGWWSDRRRARDALAANQADAPRSLAEADIRATPRDQSATSADADLIARRDEAATLPAGAAEDAFLNRADEGLAVLADPDVLVLESPLASDRDVETLLLAAGRRGRPLVIVAPDFSARALGTLRANALRGSVRTLPVPLADPAARRRAVALTGGRAVAEADLASGWLPDRDWGRCVGWLADLDDSWVLREQA